jgi:hypothetical protein
MVIPVRTGILAYETDTLTLTLKVITAETQMVEREHGVIQTELHQVEAGSTVT